MLLHAMQYYIYEVNRLACVYSFGLSYRVSHLLATGESEWNRWNVEFSVKQKHRIEHKANDTKVISTRMQRHYSTAVHVRLVHPYNDTSNEIVAWRE